MIPNEPGLAIAVITVYGTLGVALIGQIGSWVHAVITQRRSDRQLAQVGRDAKAARGQVENGGTNLRVEIAAMAADIRLMRAEMGTQFGDIREELRDRRSAHAKLEERVAVIEG